MGKTTTGKWWFTNGWKRVLYPVFGQTQCGEPGEANSMGVFIDVTVGVPSFGLLGRSL